MRAPEEWGRWKRGSGGSGRRCCVCHDIKKASEDMEVEKRELVDQQGYGDSYDYTI